MDRKCKQYRKLTPLGQFFGENRAMLDKPPYNQPNDQESEPSRQLGMFPAMQTIAIGVSASQFWYAVSEWFGPEEPQARAIATELSKTFIHALYTDAMLERQIKAVPSFYDDEEAPK